MCTFTIADEAGDIVQALLRVAERCFNLLNEPPILSRQQTIITSQLYGVTLSSPLTFLRIIHQLQPLFKGGGYVESFFTEKFVTVFDYF